jgi:hypothetical protein
MCRNIRVLLHFEPPATDEEMRAAALQYVRKVTGAQRPSKANAERFAHAVDEVARVTRELLGSMEVHGPPKSRDVEAAKARARNAKRFGRPGAT